VLVVSQETLLTNPRLGSDYGSDLVIWSTAESAVTIVAASIPILRVLIREFAQKTLYGSASNGDKTRKSRLDQTHVMELGSGNGEDNSIGDANEHMDNRSDRHILNDLGIVETTEVQVSRNRTESDAKSTRYGFHVV
jgi:hypothetical protein